MIVRNIVAAFTALLLLGVSPAMAIPRLAGTLGKAKDGKATLQILEGSAKGTYSIVRDIKGFINYPGTHIIAYDATIEGATIDFQKFEWATLDDFIMSDADILQGWELPEKFGKREITGSALKNLPAITTFAQPPVRGVAQRLVVHVGDELHAYQIRYYDFNSSSAAAMFAPRWSAKKGVPRDTAEHYRRAFDKYAVWVLNADDERKTPDYWVARFILESLSRKALIALDTAVIFNHKNADAVVFSVEPDTAGLGDRIVLNGQGFSPFMKDNVIDCQGQPDALFRTISSTSHQITAEVPKRLVGETEFIDVPVRVLVKNYAATNPVTLHVRR